MSNKHWQQQLQAQINRLATAERLPRVAFVGIGHELCGDDAAGVCAAASLRPLLSGEERCLVVEAGPAPENFTSVLRRFKPDLVVLLDSALMGETPGTVRWLDWQETESVSASTHTLPLHILGSYLTAELGCQMGLIGIQPEQTFADAPLTACVQSATDHVVGALVECFNVPEGLSSTI